MDKPSRIFDSPSQDLESRFSLLHSEILNAFRKRFKETYLAYDLYDTELENLEARLKKMLEEALLFENKSFVLKKLEDLYQELSLIHSEATLDYQMRIQKRETVLSYKKAARLYGDDGSL